MAGSSPQSKATDVGHPPPVIEPWQVRACCRPFGNLVTGRLFLQSSIPSQTRRKPMAVVKVIELLGESSAIPSF